MRRTLDYVLACALFLLPWIPFGQTLQFSFTGFDDQLYVSSNPHVLTGLTWDNARWAFSTFQTANWHPLTWLSLMLDASLGGTSPSVFHTTNVLLHSLTAALLFLALQRSTGLPLRSAAVAALFAVHPLRAESVAWIAERKDVLSAFFFALALYLYSYGVAGRRLTRRRWLGISAVYALGLLAKPMLVTLPLVFLILDVWPLRRWPVTRRSLLPPKHLVLEKLPLFLLSIASSVITVMAQRAGGAVAQLQEIPLAQRAANAVVSVVVYVMDVLWPRGLAVLYPFPAHGIPLWQVVGATLLVAGASIVALYLIHRKPYVFTGWAWFLVMLLPVIGIVQIGIQSRADRYTYLPSVGLTLLMVWAVADAFGRYLEPTRARAASALAFSAVLLALLVACTEQVGHWRNRLTLFNRLAHVLPNYPNAHLTVGMELERTGDPEGARLAFETALRVAPSSADAHTNLAEWQLRHGTAEAALEHAHQATRLGPDLPEGHLALAGALAKLGRPAEAGSSYRRVLELRPSAEAYAGLAYALVAAGDLKGATAAMVAARELSPESHTLQNDLGALYLRQGSYEEAVAPLTRAVALAPLNAPSQSSLGEALLRVGRADEALLHFEEALRLAPDLAPAHFGRGLIFAKRQQLSAARQEFERVLELQPDNQRARHNLELLKRLNPGSSHQGSGGT